MASVMLLGPKIPTYMASQFSLSVRDLPAPNKLYRFGALLTTPTQLFYQKTHTGNTPDDKFAYAPYDRTFIRGQDLHAFLKDVVFKVIYVISGLFILDLIGCAISGLGLLLSGLKYAHNYRERLFSIANKHQSNVKELLDCYNKNFDMLCLGLNSMQHDAYENDQKINNPGLYHSKARAMIDWANGFAAIMPDIGRDLPKIEAEIKKWESIEHGIMNEYIQTQLKHDLKSMPLQQHLQNMIDIVRTAYQASKEKYEHFLSTI